MSIEKLPDGSGYKVRWKDAAGKSRRKTVRLWRDAVNLDGDIKRKKAMGELIAHERGTVRLDEFWERWCSLTQVTPRTLDCYARLYKKHISPVLGRHRLKDIDGEEVAALIAGLRLAPSSVRKVVAVLQGVLQKAVEWQYIAMNPARVAKKPKLAGSQRRGRALETAQIEALLAELPDLRSRTIVSVLAYTGIRPGELRGLHWSDVSRLGNYAIHVERAVSKDVLGPTKTASTRVVRPEYEAILALARWSEACYPVDQSRPLFPGSSGGIWTDQGWRMWQRQVFKPAAERAGLAGAVPYDLRHTFASTLIAEGMDVYRVARQLGHSPTVTLTTYAHEFESQQETKHELSALRHVRTDAPAGH